MLGGDFVLGVPNPFLKKCSNCHASDITWLSHIVRVPSISSPPLLFGVNRIRPMDRGDAHT